VATAVGRLATRTARGRRILTIQPGFTLTPVGDAPPRGGLRGARVDPAIDWLPCHRWPTRASKTGTGRSRLNALCVGLHRRVSDNMARSTSMDGQWLRSPSAVKPTRRTGAGRSRLDHRLATVGPWTRTRSTTALTSSGSSARWPRGSSPRKVGAGASSTRTRSAMGRTECSRWSGSGGGSSSTAGRRCGVARLMRPGWWVLGAAGSCSHRQVRPQGVAERPG
jgi:hypothetical protein